MIAPEFRPREPFWPLAVRGVCRCAVFLLSGLLPVVLTPLFCGCQTAGPQRCGRCDVSAELERFTGGSLGHPSFAGEPDIPAKISLDDGLGEDEAVLLTLRNNAAFQAMLSELDMARGDVLQAGLLTNPEFSTMLPVGPKQWEFTLTLPVEAFLLRPRRVAIAQSEYDRIGSQLVQNGLDLVRDVRVAYADLAVAVSRADLADESVQIRSHIAELTQKRLSAGAISELETATAQVDVHRARAQAVSLRQDIVLARDRLKELMGLIFSEVAIDVIASQDPESCSRHATDLLERDRDELIAEALSDRPDVRVAEIAIQATRERAGLARWSFLELGALADANSPGRRKRFEFGPGLSLRVPIFNRNQGGVVRANAEVEQACRNYEALCQQVSLQVRNAGTQLRQAQQNLDALRSEVLPSLETAVRLAEKAFQGGGASYVLYWQTAGQLLEARGRELDLQLSLYRAIAELERSVGKCRLQRFNEQISQLSTDTVEVAEGPHYETFGETGRRVGDDDGWRPWMPR